MRPYRAILVAVALACCGCDTAVVPGKGVELSCAGRCGIKRVLLASTDPHDNGFLCDACDKVLRDHWGERKAIKLTIYGQIAVGECPQCKTGTELLQDRVGTISPSDDGLAIEYCHTCTSRICPKCRVLCGPGGKRLAPGGLDHFDCFKEHRDSGEALFQCAGMCGDFRDKPFQCEECRQIDGPM